MSTTLKVPYILYEADNLGSLHNHWNVGLEVRPVFTLLRPQKACQLPHTRMTVTNGMGWRILLDHIWLLSKDTSEQGWC